MRACLKYTQDNQSFVCKTNTRTSAHTDGYHKLCLLPAYVKVWEKYRLDLLVCDAEKEGYFICRFWTAYNDDEDMIMIKENSQAALMV